MSDISLVTEAAEAAVQRTFARMPRTVVRHGTVVDLETGGPNIHDVIIDGDTESIAVHDVTHGSVIIGDRVTVLFAQPHQALIIGLPITDTWHLVGGEAEPAFGTGWRNRLVSDSGGIATSPPGTSEEIGGDSTPVNNPSVVSFRRNWSVVEIRGSAWRASGSEATIFVMPTGYRPRNRLSFTATGALTARAVVDVFTDGSVEFISGTPTPLILDGISYTLR